jgi:hypothetical protein
MHIVNGENQLPTWIRGWPRGLRVASAWLALLATAIVILPLAATALFYLFHVDSCESTSAPTSSWLCTREGRWLLMAIAVPLVLLPALAWGKFLQRVINYRGSATQDVPEHTFQTFLKAPRSIGPTCSRAAFSVRRHQFVLPKLACGGVRQGAAHFLERIPSTEIAAHAGPAYQCCVPDSA